MKKISFDLLKLKRQVREYLDMPQLYEHYKVDE